VLVMDQVMGDASPPALSASHLSAGATAFSFFPLFLFPLL